MSGRAHAITVIFVTAVGSVAVARVLPRRADAEPARLVALAEPPVSVLAPDSDPSPAPARGAAPEPEPEPEDDTPPKTLALQRRALFHSMEARLDLTADQLEEVEHIFAGSPVLGQGNPAVTRYGMKRSECRRIRAEAGLRSEAHAPCDRRNMVPVYDPEAGETSADARVCIDQFEFPDIACEYPVVHVTAREAAELCAAEGKRICDAHEWEGACAGALHAPEVEYAFGVPRPLATWRHNKDRDVRWAYGPRKDHTLCATGTFKTPGCIGGGWSQCGSNTYPAGSFPACVSPFGVYDQHGNAAEHMNLPLSPGELGSRGGTGATEMKGSWFVFQHQEAHEDDCRWRAKDWHPSKLMARDSHENYHLGFRCCADVDASDDADR
jgi:formylglycine-generating enzyme